MNSEILLTGAALLGAFIVARVWRERNPPLLTGEALQNKFPKRVIIIGPPASGKSTISRKLNQRMNLIEVHTDLIMEKAMGDKDNVIGQQLKNFFEEHKGDNARPPASLFMPLLVQEFNQLSKDHPNRGWLLERGCREIRDFDLYRKAGIWPEKVIVLSVPDEAILARVTSRLVDPLTNDVFDSVSVKSASEEVKKRLERRPDDLDVEVVKKRIERYKSRSLPVVELYPKEIVKVVDASRAPEDVYQEIASLIDE